MCPYGYTVCVKLSQQCPRQHVWLIPAFFRPTGTRCRDAPSIVLPHQDANYISHIALDIGGSLIKLIHFSTEEPVQNGDNGHYARPSQTRSTGGKHCVVQRSLATVCLPYKVESTLGILCRLATVATVRR